jgi:hypothetical protein
VESSCGHHRSQFPKYKEQIQTPLVKSWSHKRSVLLFCCWILRLCLTCLKSPSLYLQCSACILWHIYKAYRRASCQEHTSLFTTHYEKRKWTYTPSRWSLKIWSNALQSSKMVYSWACRRHTYVYKKYPILP